MLKRKVYEDLLKWKKEANGKALCIIGARQIGKTTLIREFGKNEYEYFAELNFVTDERAADIFNGKLTAEAVITNLTAYLQTPLEPGKTLILFDEVQECPRVRSAIKFLVEDGRFDYIESGSLLGVRYKDVTSYPVGFEQILPMYPLDFEEYLWANGIQNHTLQYLKSCYDKKEKVSETVHEPLCKLFYSYLVVGGMPETVQIYVDTHDIAKVVLNQRTALRAVRDGRKFVTQADLEESVEVVIAGYQKKNKIMTDKEKLIVSYHEVGHALVAALQSHSAPVTKITIIPRTSGALGYTMQVDEDEHNLMSREELENKIATLTSGRVAEDLVFHSITTGATNDIEQATKVARAMITRFGMNEEFGMVAFETVTNQYLGGDTSLACSESTAAQIDEKVVAAVRKQYDKAEQLLKDNMPKLHELAKYLYEKETITGDEFMEILNLSPDQLTTTRMETN